MFKVGQTIRLKYNHELLVVKEIQDLPDGEGETRWYRCVSSDPNCSGGYWYRGNSLESIVTPDNIPCGAKVMYKGEYGHVVWRTTNGDGVIQYKVIFLFKTLFLKRDEFTLVEDVPATKEVIDGWVVYDKEGTAILFVRDLKDIPDTYQEEQVTIKPMVWEVLT
jgi:hypothetical protein